MMDLTLLRNKDAFPLHVLDRLEHSPIDYREKHLSIVHANANGAHHLEAGVVVLLNYKDSEYVFQLIKRSDAVPQAGDISCPGGILERSTDEMLSHIISKTGIIRRMDDRLINDSHTGDEQTSSLIRLFLMNALRESWEEIGLSPLNVGFLGALPSYSLAYFPRTIFPVVCLVKEPFAYQLNPEVEKVLEIPVSRFFENSSYATVEIESDLGSTDPRYNVQFPCMPIPDGQGNQDILWGATFCIITTFLQIISGETFPPLTPSRIIKKTLAAHYASGRRR